MNTYLLLLFFEEIQNEVFTHKHFHWLNTILLLIIAITN